MIASVERDDAITELEGWAEVPLIEAVTLQRGFDLPVQDRSAGTVPIYAANGPVGTHNIARVKGPGVVTGRSGTIGKVHFVEKDFWPLNTSLYVKDFHGNDPKFVALLLKTLGLERYLAGTGVPTLNRNIVHEVVVTIPPLREQQRIVAKAESLSHYAEVTRAHLSRIPTILKRFRQAVLAAACSGRLTEDWRALNSPPEPTNALLKRISSDPNRGPHHKRGPMTLDKVYPEVMIPMAATLKEMANQTAIVRRVAKEVFTEKETTVDFLVGAMIELPRAALVADEIAKEAEFFSFGTNDLTQTTWGLSRDDAKTTLQTYLELGIIRQDPFAVLDREGVGQLAKMATEKGRKTRSNLKVGICGEHGGEPSSVEFCYRTGLNYVSCSPMRVLTARLAAAQSAAAEKLEAEAKSATPA